MKTCWCSLAGTEVCNNCGNNLTVGNVIPINNNNVYIKDSLWQNNQPLPSVNMKQLLLDKLSDAELLAEIAKRMNNKKIK